MLTPDAALCQVHGPVAELGAAHQSANRVCRFLPVGRLEYLVCGEEPACGLTGSAHDGLSRSQ